MERALIIGASGGIGAAMVAELCDRGADVVGLSRATDRLDVTDADSVASALGTLEGCFDRVVVATGILAPPTQGPEKTLGAIDAASMARVLSVNAIGPALILARLPRLLPLDRRAVVGVLTARVGSIGDNHLGGWYAYRASKAAANQITRSAAIEIRRKRKLAIVVALHPGTVATPFTADYPTHKKMTPEVAAASLLRVMDDLTPAQSGGFFDYSGADVPW